MISGFARPGAVDLYFELWPPDPSAATGVAVLLIPGLGRPLIDFLPRFMGHLIAAGATVVTMDCRDAGRSSQLDGKVRRADLVAAVLGSPDCTDALRSLDVPTVVIHGTLDPLIDISGALATAEAVPGASFLAVSGLGHQCPFPSSHDVAIAAAVIGLCNR